MSDPTTKLPPGKTCTDCAHIRRCCAFGYSWEGRTSCDFAPSRFVEWQPTTTRPSPSESGPDGRSE